MVPDSSERQSRWRCWIRGGHDWWSFSELIHKWVPTPTWYVGSNPPTSATCARCGKRTLTNYRFPSRIGGW